MISEQARQIAREAATACAASPQGFTPKAIADRVLSALDHQGMLGQPIDHKDDARLATASAGDSAADLRIQDRASSTLNDMRRASVLCDEMIGPGTYATRMIALAMIARQYLRELVALEPTREEEQAITAVVREADQRFQKSGGSSRHWVRECFLPLLHEAGWRLVSIGSGNQATNAERATATDRSAAKESHSHSDNPLQGEERSQ